MNALKALGVSLLLAAFALVGTWASTYASQLTDTVRVPDVAKPSSCPYEDQSGGFGGQSGSCTFSCSPGAISLSVQADDKDAGVSGSGSCGGGAMHCTGQQSCGAGDTATGSGSGTCSGDSDEMIDSGLYVDCSSNDDSGGGVQVPKVPTKAPLPEASDADQPSLSAGAPRAPKPSAPDAPEGPKAPSAPKAPKPSVPRTGVPPLPTGGGVTCAAGDDASGATATPTVCIPTAAMPRSTTAGPGTVPLSACLVASVGTGVGLCDTKLSVGRAATITELLSARATLHLNLTLTAPGTSAHLVYAGGYVTALVCWNDACIQRLPTCVDVPQSREMRCTAE